jgi:hypothetical protein
MKYTDSQNQISTNEQQKTRMLFFCFSLFLFAARAQDKTYYKFGKITAADFNLSAEKFDSGANAVIIADIGNSSFEGNNKGSFNLVFTRFMRVKIINKNGVDIGTQEILLFNDRVGDAEKLFSLRGSSFNLENGVVTETKLDEKSIFNEKSSKNYDIRKFSMPALKEGTIFDLVYTIKSPFDTELRPWSFQGNYPRLWSEYEVVIPSPYHYVVRMQGEQNFYIDTIKHKSENFSIHEDQGASPTDTYNLSGNSTDRRWVKRYVPALHEEPFTTTLDNYNSTVTFQLNYFQWNSQSERHDYMSTWNNRSKALMEDEDFGKALSRENNWMSDELKGIVAGANSDEEKTRMIFSFIRDNLKAISDHGLYAHNALKDVFKKKEGNVAEINLLLTSMLRKAGIHADPVILSTRENGIANPGYPLISEYNYVICIAYAGNKSFLLDASQPYYGFGQLPAACYNGYAHIINEERPLPLFFSSDSLPETSLTNIILVCDDKGRLTGRYTSILGNYESYDVRKEIGGSSEKKYQIKIQTENGSDFDMEDFSIDSLKKFDFPLTIHYDFNLKNSTEDILYFNPMLNEGYKTNPFKSMNRHYPVEMPYRIDETYLLTMDIPNGYKVDELPKSARVKYNENEGIFEYLIQKGESNLQMRVHLKLNKAFFPVDEYSTLRDFFAYVISKESEQIVFKKIH